MPVYEYRCREGHRYERTQGFHSLTEHECLHCGKPAQRQISVPAVIFKGSGFYSTDNRKSGGGNGRTSTTESASSNGHSHDGDHGHSHGSSEPKVEAAAE